MKHLFLASMLTLSSALAQTATPTAPTSQSMPAKGTPPGDADAMMRQCMQMMQGMNGMMSGGMMSMMGGEAQKMNSGGMMSMMGSKAQEMNRAAIEAIARAYLKGQNSGSSEAVQFIAVQSSGGQYQVRYRQGNQTGVLQIDTVTGDVTLP